MTGGSPSCTYEQERALLLSCAGGQRLSGNSTLRMAKAAVLDLFKAQRVFWKLSHLKDQAGLEREQVSLQMRQSKNQGGIACHSMHAHAWQVTTVQRLHSQQKASDRKKLYMRRGRAMVGELLGEEQLTGMCQWGLQAVVVGRDEDGDDITQVAGWVEFKKYPLQERFVYAWPLNTSRTVYRSLRQALALDLLALAGGTWCSWPCSTGCLPSPSH
jgi:hypothetical protein